jgi:hypothetical protein
MKTNKQFRFFLLLFVFFLVVPGCKVFLRNQHSNGELISTKPHGRLAPDETDDMSGKKNEKAFEINKKSMEKGKMSGEKNKKHYKPRQTKKHKRR